MTIEDSSGDGNAPHARHCVAEQMPASGATELGDRTATTLSVQATGVGMREAAAQFDLEQIVATLIGAAENDDEIGQVLKGMYAFQSAGVLSEATADRLQTAANKRRGVGEVVAFPGKPP
jgi:hypothetical protein